jgi:hypothetical protein
MVAQEREGDGEQIVVMTVGSARTKSGQVDSGWCTMFKRS